MARDWETWLKNSIGPSSATEQDDRDRTEKSIRDAIAASPLYGHVRVYAKGSYANNTNVRRDSDVDIVVEWTDWMYIERVNEARSLSWDALGVPLVDRGPSPAEFRSQVVQALVSHFGARRVDTSGDKAITVAAGSSTLDADVVPCFRYKRYFSTSYSERGTKLFPKTGAAIIGWPEQQKVKGNKKNADTSRRYKQLIRAIKRLENDMLDTGRLESPVAGYFIECLLYNVPDWVFTADASYYTTAKYLLHTLHDDIDKGSHSDWVEVNGLKWLWRDGQTWTAAEAYDFAEKGLHFLLKT